MQISFISKQNHISSDDPDFYFKEIEDLTYHCQISPDNGSYTLTMTSETKSTDINRAFLTKQYRLEEASSPGNTFSFWIYDGNTQIGKLFFNYYHDTDFKTFNVCIETNIFQSIKGMVLLVFKRLENFKLYP